MSEPAWTQLSLGGTDDLAHYRRDEVMAIDLRHSENGQRVRDLARLGYLPEPVLDPTFGYGSMWTEYMPEQLVAGDFDRRKVPPGGLVLDFCALPFDDRSFASCLYDPPYRFAGTPTDTGEGGHDDLYGTQVYRTKAQQIGLILDGAVECARVTSTSLIVKCQRQVVAGRVFPQPMVVCDHLADQGWRYKDEMHLISYRPQPPGRRQLHARSNYSTFLVMERGDPAMF